jgi:uncharacterized membrane protein
MRPRHDEGVGKAHRIVASLLLVLVVAAFAACILFAALAEERPRRGLIVIDPGRR